jgi:hypothetical protein
MKQQSLFDGDDRRGADRPIVPLGMVGDAASLSKAQRRFNRLIADIEVARHELARWNAYLPIYGQRVRAEIEPIQTRLRQAHIAMVELLDRAMRGGRLIKTQRAKVRGILSSMLSGLLEEGHEPALEKLHDKYCGVRYEEGQRQEAEMLRELASDFLGVGVDDDAISSPEAMARAIGQKMRAPAGEAEPAPRTRRKKSAQAAARETVRQQAEQGASRSVREIYRKLVSELHPDREMDPVERARKTQLIQKVNQAYEGKDLLALLELQLAIEQIDPLALANMAEERLQHYNLVLEEQLKRLQQEVSELAMPFVMMLADAVPRKVTPAVVQRAIDEDLQTMRLDLQQLQSDLERFRDIRQLKASLRDYRIQAVGEDDLNALATLLFEGRRGRRR